MELACVEAYSICTGQNGYRAHQYWQSKPNEENLGSAAAAINEAPSIDPTIEPKRPWPSPNLHQ
uniref:Uncharacterized protein n=1 Tax=Ectopseudomonas oleovorans TaxID=301 RepID=A0A653BD13_ECTOL